MDSIRILHLVNGEHYAGAERVQDLLALELPSQGFTVGFACLKDGIFGEKRQAQAAPLFRFPMQSRLDFSIGFRLAQLVRAEGYRLLHTHTPRAALVGNFVARLARVPWVHHVHSPTERDTEQGWRNARNSVIERLSLQGAGRLIAVSESLETHLKSRGLQPDRIVRVPNGVPVGDCVRRPYRPGQPLALGTVALFRPRKGIEMLLQAMAQLRDAHADVTLHAVGPFETPDYERTIAGLTRELGLENVVRWTGFSANVREQFRYMHLFVLPSLYGEGMPMVVLEAMAAGLPVLSTRVEGIPEVVRHGQDGLITEPADSRALAAAVLEFYGGSADATAMGDSSWRRQRECFSATAMAAGVAAVYRQVLDS